MPRVKHPVASPAVAFRASCWRVYLSHQARRAHLLHPGDSPDRGGPALCGRRPWFAWHGTGNWDERDHAARLATCRACLNMLAKMSP